VKLLPDLSNFQDVFQTSPQGLFISFEGIEGSGKTTQIQLLTDYFEAQQRPVLKLREPGGTQLGEQLRSTILTQTDRLDPLTETFIFLASRVELLRQKILPFLQQPGAVVLVDRYVDSTLVYQALAQGRELAQIWGLHQFEPLNLLPHVTFFLDISVDISLQRQDIRGQEKDYFESRQRTFQEALMTGYRELAHRYPKRIVRMNAEVDATSIHRHLINILREKGWA
jgi:dTMP kinase